MKIAKINNYFRKNYATIALTYGIATLFGAATLPTAGFENKTNAEAYKKEIQTKDIERFEKLKASEPKSSLIHANHMYWKNEADKMNDSLRIDSIIQKAYFEGAQMVRDSIANANNK